MNFNEEKVMPDFDREALKRRYAADPAYDGP
jgi:hypothetical protein